MLLEITEPGQGKSKEATPAVGIDLGTTNSVVALYENGTYKTFADGKSDIIPSVVEYKGEEVHSIKRLMGKGVDDEKAVQVSSEILKKLKNLVEKELDKQVSKAVITVPAYFDDAARQATKDAAKLAGLEVLRLINEPTSAALAYGLDNEVEGIYAVYDLGGGTFDISILKMEKGVFRVLSTGGDTELGGDDFDQIVVEKLGCDLQKARKIKENLTDAEESEGITKEEFEELIRDLVVKTITTCKQAVLDADISLNEIKGVVLVGGSTRVPLVREEVANYFGQDSLGDIDPDRVVAYGASVQAANLTQGLGTLLLDVCPLSLGLETYGDLVEKIIERNTPIPVSKSQEFTTHQDNQTAMKIHILQGEREMVEHCRSLAEFNLTGIPPMKAGLAKVKVTFILDADGLLTVSAIEETTQAEQKIEIKPSYGLPPEKMEEMLRESFSNAKDDIMSRLLAESRIEANQVIRYIEEALESDSGLVDGNYLENIKESISQLKQAINGTNREEIDAKVMELDEICRDFAEKRVDKALKQAIGGKKVEEVKLNGTNN